MMKRRKFIYTISTFRGETKRYIVSKEAFVDKLAIQLGDYDCVAGWCGITSANYENANKMIRKLKQKHNAGVLCDEISYRIFDTDEWEKYPQKWKDEYSLYVGDIHKL